MYKIDRMGEREGVQKSFSSTEPISWGMEEGSPEFLK